ncbi:MAG: undecaprenyl-diphosphate phosphatase [Salinispira sp.]
MTATESLLFGLIQGLTEFLPVSSSGHLALMKNLWGLENIPLVFDILLHFATLLAVLIMFRTRLGELMRSVYRSITGRADEQDRMHIRLIGLIIAATIVTAVLGIAIGSIPGLGENITVISICFMITALILLASSKLPIGNKNYGNITVKDSLFIGLAQGVGVFPGISRSGISISAGLAMGLKREVAGEFSFILSIPAIIGAALLKIRDLSDMSEHIGIPVLFLGMLAAFISGFFSLMFLMRLVRQGKFFYFAFYLIPLSIVGLLWL